MMQERSNFTGAPDPVYGNVSDISRKKILDYFLQEHDSYNAGLHHDLRMGDSRGLYSWALPDGMPTSGGSGLAVRTRLHPYEYGSYEGKRKRDTVRLADKGKIRMLDAGPYRLKFEITRDKGPETYVLEKRRKDKWTLRNVTGEPDDNVEKTAVVNLDIEKGDTLLFGRFKNMKEIAKDIGEDENGQPTVNGKKLLACRIEKKMPKKAEEDEGKYYHYVLSDDAKETLRKILASGVLKPGGSVPGTEAEYLKRLPKYRRDDSAIYLTPRKIPVESPYFEVPADRVPDPEIQLKRKTITAEQLADWLRKNDYADTFSKTKSSRRFRKVPQILFRGEIPVTEKDLVDESKAAADMYLADGEAVQAVGLRKSYHRILDEHKVSGVAVNDQSTGNVKLIIDADEQKRQAVFDALSAYVKDRTGKDVTFTKSDKDPELVRVKVTGKDLERSNAVNYLGYLRSGKYDPSDNWMNSKADHLKMMAERFRLERKGRHHVGLVLPEALPQLRGEKPMYRAFEPDMAVRSEEEALALAPEDSRKRLLEILAMTPLGKAAAERITKKDPPRVVPNFPHLRQEKDYTCGASSVLSILQYHGITDKTESDIAELLGTTEADGSDWNKIVEVLRSFGLDARVRENATEEALRNMVDRGVPVLVNLQAWPTKPVKSYKKERDEGHYAVLTGYDADEFHFSDPASKKPVAMPTEGFSNRWHDEGKVKGVPASTNRLMIWVEPKQSLKRLLETLEKNPLKKASLALSYRKGKQP